MNIKKKIFLLVVCVMALIGLTTYWMKSTRNTYLASIEFEKKLPEVGRPGGYVSSSQCKSCHPEQYSTWHDTYHRTMTQHASEETVLGDFNNVILYDADFAYQLVSNKDGYFVDVYAFPKGIEPDLNKYKEIAKLENRYQVGLLTGSHNMQVCWLTSENGNLQKIFPFAWLISDKRWVPRKDIFLRDPKLPMKLQVWNNSCYRCHSTAAQPLPNLETGAAHSKVAETGIGCEACHGPGKEHIDFYSNPLERYSRRNKSQDAHLGKSDYKNFITNPAKLNSKLSSHTCAQCHSVKWFVDGPELWKTGFSFKPGDDLNERTPVVRPTQIENQPWLHSLIKKSPDILHRQFWPDGQIRVSGREFNGMVESECYQKSELSCLDCHQMHGANPVNQLSEGMSSNQACAKCHSNITQNVSEHSRHPADSPGSHCYNCHMPHTVYGLLKAMRSHEIDSPSVGDQMASQRPNACSLCHLDKPLSWVSENLGNWYEQEKPELTKDQKNIPEGLRMALSGDPNQRALIAWHLGWEPAIKASYQNWFIPLLFELFKDEYSAIRYIAGKGINRLIPEAPLLDYVAKTQLRNASLLIAKKLFQKNLIENETELQWLSSESYGEIETSLLKRLRNLRPKKSMQLVE